MKLAKFFFGFVVICLFTLFATANLQKVQVNFLFEDQPLLGYSQIKPEPDTQIGTFEKTPRQIPLFLVIFGTFGFGFIVSWMLSSGLIRSHKRNFKHLKKEFDLLAKERDELRNLPVNTPNDADKNSDKKPSALPVK